MKRPATPAQVLRILVENHEASRRRLPWDVVLLIAGMLFVIGLIVYIGTVGV